MAPFHGGNFKALYAQVLRVTSAWQAAAGAPPPPPAAAAAAAAAPSDDDDDEILITAERSLDEVEAEKLERAKLSGDYIDLSDVSDETLADAEAQAQAARQKASAAGPARREAELRSLQAERAAVLQVGGGFLAARR